MIESSPKQNIISQWLNWHYFEVSKNLLMASRNFLVFNFNYFSISLLLTTLFAHWRRYRDFYGKSFDIKRYAFTFISNMISRVLGAFIRTIVVAIGLAIEMVIFIISAIGLIVWIFFPPFLLILLISGFQLLMGI